MLSALSHLHLHGVMHRDIKPENLLLAHPLGWEVQLSDFGLVRVMEGTWQAARLKEKSGKGRSGKGRSHVLPGVGGGDGTGGGGGGGGGEGTRRLTANAMSDSSCSSEDEDEDSEDDKDDSGEESPPPPPPYEVRRDTPVRTCSTHLQCALAVRTGSMLYRKNAAHFFFSLVTPSTPLSPLSLLCPPFRSSSTTTSPAAWCTPGSRCLRPAL